MAEYIRARTVEQKNQRLEEIKSAAHELFLKQNYHDITLTTIAQRLGWTRAMLYKYVTTKEEIFLAISADKRAAYFDALRVAYPLGADYSHATLSQVWAQIINCHRSYFCYSNIMCSIIETNVGIDTLASFKKSFYEDEISIEEQFSTNLGISREKAHTLFQNIQYHTTGTNCSCCQENQLVEEALKKACIKNTCSDFVTDLKDFILMSLDWYCGNKQATKNVNS